MFGLLEEIVKIAENATTIIVKPIELTAHVINIPLEIAADVATEVVKEIKES